MNPAVQAAVDSLRAAGVIAADAAPPADHPADRPWFVALLQGFAGWLAGLFLLVFLGFTFRPDSQATIMLLGALLLGAAWSIYRLDRDAVFLDQFALALSIAGQLAVAWGVAEQRHSGLSLAVTLLVLQLAIWLLMPNRVARTLAAFFATVAWLYTVRFLFVPGEGDDILWGWSRDPALPAWMMAISWPLSWGPLAALAGWLLHREARWMAGANRERTRPLLTGLILGLALSGLAVDPFGAWFLGTQTLGLPVNGWALFPMLNIALALFAAYGAFRLRSGGLLGFAVLAALLHLSKFYYLYGTTLLAKSALMLTTGVGLLALGIWLEQRRREGVPA